MQTIKNSATYLGGLLSRAAIAFTIGISGGVLGTVFLWLFHKAVAISKGYSFTLYFLPLVGLLIVLAYQVTGRSKDGGTNEIISAVREGNEISPWMMPLIALGTVLSHACGASVGKEGAALQLGGSLGNNIARLLRQKEDEMVLYSLCGMAAVFSAAFGTPAAAAVFVLEFISVGVIFSSALPATLISSYSALWISRLLGTEYEAYPQPSLPAVTPGSLCRYVLLGIILGVAAIAFCMLLHHCEEMGKKRLPDARIRVVIGGALFILLTLLPHGRSLTGSGSSILLLTLEGETPVFCFFAGKMLATALCVSAGYKGGEIVPTLTIGGTLGAVVAGFLGIEPVLGAMLGMIGLFCGVTNAFVASLFLGVELFGYEYFPALVLVTGISYLLSGNYSLYKTQHVPFSKISGKLFHRVG